MASGNKPSRPTIIVAFMEAISLWGPTCESRVALDHWAGRRAIRAAGPRRLNPIKFKSVVPSESDSESDGGGLAVNIGPCHESLSGPGPGQAAGPAAGLWALDY